MVVTVKVQPALLAGLTAAFASSSECLLISSRTQPGLFPATAVGKAAAKAAQEAGWLNVVRSETKGKSLNTYVSLSQAGMEYLLTQNNPKPLLEAIQTQLHQLESTHSELRKQLQNCQLQIETLRSKTEQLERLAGSTVTHEKVTMPDWESTISGYLMNRQVSRPAEDCPLTELYQHAKQQMPQLSVGTFHDGIRRLQARHEIDLQPWTGSLHELPQPELALMQGHSVAYYASPRG
ncbi:MAG: hypothetical protein JNJ77_16940 [Planctomycetia bacterium]|nr:hypothetical protein [Planctomycetia bacterium]